eukprot:4126829-Prorocentrum_lima.AAC.1
MGGGVGSRPRLPSIPGTVGTLLRPLAAQGPRGRSPHRPPHSGGVPDAGRHLGRTRMPGLSRPRHRAREL